MVAYRFCRPDDAGQIVDAIQVCFDVHFQGEETSLEQLQREIREIDLWPSNCMLASEGSEPIAICTAAKRPREVLVQRIGVRPGCERQGHGSHLLTSLRKKLQVLGPPRLITEIPEQRKDLAGFFAAQGWRAEETYTDFWLDEPLEALQKPGAMIPVTVSELLESGLITDDPCLSWERQLRTLQQCADQFCGWAVASLERIEAGLLCHDRVNPPCRAILRLAAQESAPEPRLMAELLLRVVASEQGPIVFPKVSESEKVGDWLRGIGFQPRERWVRFGISGPDFEKE